MPLSSNHSDDKIDSKTGLTHEQWRDQTSHYILRLAYCRTEDLINSFCEQECELLKYRLDELSNIEKIGFMNVNGLIYVEDRSDLKDKLIFGINNELFLQTTYFKAPFQEAISLIYTGEASLHSLIAYVP